MAIVPAQTASAAEWGIQKVETSVGPYEPGDQVEWIVEISCSDPNATACANAVLTDPLPDGLELVSASIQSGPPDGTIDVDTDSDTVTAQWPSVPNGQGAEILVTAEVDPDLPYSQSGETITNTATVVADNAAQDQASDDIAPVVPLVLDSETTKSIDPEGALAEPGTPATMTLGSTNTSNDPVDTLVIQDPVDPSADPNPFTLLQYTGTGTITYPPNADTVTQEYWDGDSWETLDDAVDPADVQGVRYTFSGDIQPGATATVPVEVQQSDAVEDLTDATTVTNDASSYVTHGDDESVPTTAADTYVITPPNNSVTAAKSFDPATVSAGDPTTVTIGATNTGTPVDSMSITEPAPGTDSPFEGDDPLTFTGFGPSGDGTGVQWPADADGATVTFTCADGSTPQQTATAPDTLPNPPTGCIVVGFTVEFTGTITTGGEASIPFTADTDPDQTPSDVTHGNEIAADVPNASATASADLVTLLDRLATNTDKLISPSEFPAVDGQSVVVQLPSQLLPFGPDGSTTSADEVVIQDPTDPSNPGEFWSNFTATSVRTTDVPAGSTLTINYWDGTAWVPAPGCGPYTGPATVSCDLPPDAQGVQFVYDADEGFPPGTQFQPNFTASYTGPEDRDDPIENCGASQAESSTVSPTPPEEGCDTVDPFPVDGDGDLDFIDKTFLGAPPVSVLARSDDQATAQITWSTNGFDGVDPMVITDVADPETTAIAGSFYDAFDLVRVEAIDSGVDPLLQYDQINSVELFVDGDWVDAAGDPCPCNGSFPGYTLSPAEQESATSARLEYVESPTRAVTADPTLPQPGDGVARSTQASGRHIDLTFEVRDYKRSNPAVPVLGSTNGTIYNTTDPGLVNDTARGTATFQGDDYTDTGEDDVLIIDQPLNVSVDKEWTGGPLSVPPAGTPAEFYPSTNVVITGTNASAAKVDQLRLVEPGAEDSDDVQATAGVQPFNAFTLTHIEVTPPPGVDTTTVTLTNAAGATADFDEAEAEALSAGDLVGVVGVEVSYDGLVPAGASGSMNLTLQLREFDRYTDEPITVAADNPVPDVAVATIADPGGTAADTRRAADGASMELQDAGIDLLVGKAFDPVQIVEPSTGPVTMTLTGTPEGPSRAVEMVLTDDDPQFWNQYDFVDFDGATLTAPIDQVQVDAFVGATYSAGPDGVVVTGGSWETGEPSGSFVLPDGVDAADVQGLRFTFTRADGGIWENPATPTQTVPLTVERREDLRTGGPVLPDLAANPPAPGETAPGVASNQVDGTVTGGDLVVDPDTGDLVPVSGDDTTAADITYAHATNGVQIVKTFSGIATGGTAAPEAALPMAIEITNTGNRAIVDPVVTDDPMPTDADGAQLRLADVDEPFSYELAGAAPDPATGPAMPTDPDDVTVDQTGDLEALTFSFPPGTVLEPGQVYTITVQVQFRLGLPANSTVVNTAGVTGDRPWDQCVTRLNAQTGACEADADVTTRPSAVLAQSKAVKATNDDQLDVIVDPAAPDQSVQCTPDGNGFYVYPCTPVIAPGHDETWQIRVENVGNLPLDKLVIYDRLPAPGDAGSYASGERGSQFRPVPDVAYPPALVNAPAGAVATFSYTTVQEYCMDDIDNPVAEPVCPTDDPATGWVELPPGADQALFDSIVALKIVVTFPEDALFQPAQTVALEGTTMTPAVPPAAGDRSIAWNSAAASGVAVTVTGRQGLLPTEGTKVGVATATGPLQVEKTVIGDGAQYAPDVFYLDVACTSAVGTFLETALPPIPIQITPGTPVTVPNLPYGARCTITENASNGQTQLIVGTVTIGETPDVTNIVAINRYDLASLVVSKEVVSDAVDQDGDPVPFGPFEVQVDCTFLGNPVYATGYGPDDPMVLSLSDGDEVELDGLPVGSECVITESDTGGATEIDVTITEGSAAPEVFDGPVGQATLVGDLAGGPRNTAEITNTFDVGLLDLSKVLVGDGVQRYGAGPFRLHVLCTFDDDGDGANPPRVVYNSPVVLGGAGPLDAEISNLPVGASCLVTEPLDGGATSTTIDPQLVTIDADGPVAVVVTNTFDTGGITVDKAVDGAGADDYGTGPFEVSVACTYDGEPVAIPGGSTRPLVPGQPVVYDELPVGARCSVTETQDGEATDTTMTVTTAGQAPVESDGTSVDVVVPPVTGGQPTAVSVLVTNTFDDGAITVDKVVDGDGVDLYGAGPFEVSLACTFDGADVDIPGGAVRELVPGTPVVYEDLPVGAECAVTETATGGATTSTVSTTVDGGQPGEVVVPDGDPASVTVTNTFSVGEVRVVKSLGGEDAAAHQGDIFTVSLACTQVVDGTIVPVVIPGGTTRTLSAANSWVAVYEDLPQGAECRVVETDAGSADSVTIVVDGQGTTTDPLDGNPTSASFALPVGDDVCAPVDVVNTWSTDAGTAVGASGIGAAARVQTAAQDPASDCDDDGGVLAATGTDTLRLVTWILLLIGAGVILVQARRRSPAR
ncbi:DUF5979 domain-containing protein [Cellulomonas sp. Leaf334]|uniref:DUF5979 domain-containing protein n=1 Tax=Cellulomonas sp. Leaf334 TaxID=1736339 RepID=UPI000A728617|nr:DUF5979 domain-containing protein [Cellulomonas sp. Leaf334]